jgi:hypothetical protein
VDEKVRGFIETLGSKKAEGIERQVIQATLMASERFRNVSIEEWDFKSITLSLIKKLLLFIIRMHKLR